MAKRKASISPVVLRVKAFILDIFFIALPFFIIITLVTSSKSTITENQPLITTIWILYGIITSIFYAKTAQTPGYKANKIYLIDLRDGKKPTFLQAIFRYIVFIIGATFLVGIIICFFRKDRLNLHDIISKTAPIIEKV